MSNADCLFFIKNNCTKSGCTFRHQAGLSASTPRCRYFPNCTNPSCTFLHLSDENYARLAPGGARGFGGAPTGAPGFNQMAMNPMAMFSNPALLGLMMAQMAQGFPVPGAGKGKRNFEEDGNDQQDQQQQYDDEEEQDSRARNRNRGRNNTSNTHTGGNSNSGGSNSSSGRERGRDSGSSHSSRDRNDQKPEGLLKPPLLAQPTRPDYQARKPQTTQRQPSSDPSSSSRNQRDTRTQPRSVSVSLTPAFQNAAGRDKRPAGSQSSANPTTTNPRAKHTPGSTNSATTLQVSPAVLEKRRAAAAPAAPAKTTTTGGKPDWGVKPLTNLLDTSVLGKRDREEASDAGAHGDEQADGSYDDQYQDQDQDQDQQYDDQEPSPKRLREEDPDLSLSYGELEAGDDLNLTYEDPDQQYQEPEPSEGDGQ